eukprot:sb/3466038/
MFTNGERRWSLSIQTIVGSRHGAAHISPSRPGNPSWFNITLPDNPVLMEKCKQSVNVPSVLSGKTLTLTILLHSDEHETMTLEIWTFCLERRFENVKVTFTVYNALCLLLRSVIVASRATPTYRLTRKQTTGGFFNISYTITHGEPDIGVLGETVRSVRIGAVGSPNGTLTANVFYRTSLEMTRVVTPPRLEEISSLPPPEPTLPPLPADDSLPFCPFADTTGFLAGTTAANTVEETPFASLLESAFPFSVSVSTSQKPTSDPRGSSGHLASPDPRGSHLATPTAAPDTTVTPTPLTTTFPGSPRLSQIQREGSTSQQSDIMTSDSFVLIAPFASNSPEDVGSFFRDCSSVPKLKLYSP